MALIKCPECGKDVSDTCEQCIHCGFTLNRSKKTKTKKDTHKEPEVIAVRSRSGGIGGGILSLVVGGIMAFLGFVLLFYYWPFMIMMIVGFIFIALGINNITEARKNNNNTYDCAYYDEQNAKVIIYSIAGEKYEISPEYITDVYRPIGLLNLYVKFNDSGRMMKVDCGFCERSSVAKFQSFVENIRLAKRITAAIDDAEDEIDEE